MTKFVVRNFFGNRVSRFLTSAIFVGLFLSFDLAYNKKI